LTVDLEVAGKREPRNQRLVVDRRNRVAGGPKRSSSPDSSGVAATRLVEPPAQITPPVDDNGRVGLVGEIRSSDVPRSGDLAGLLDIDPPDQERIPGRPEFRRLLLPHAQKLPIDGAVTG
jgi:hypothetical protein